MLEGVAGNIESIIGNIGRVVDVRTVVTTGPAHDPVQTPTDTPAKAAIVNFKASEVDGSVVQTDDKKAFISSVTEVTKQAKIVDGTIVYNIEDLRLVQPGDEKFLYLAPCRK